MDPADPRLLSEKELRRKEGEFSLHLMAQQWYCGESSTVSPNWLQVGVHISQTFWVAWVQDFAIFTPNITSSSQLTLGCTLSTV